MLDKNWSLMELEKSCDIGVFHENKLADFVQVLKDTKFITNYTAPEICNKTLDTGKEGRIVSHKLINI